MKILVSSCEAVPAQTIANCFRKAGITPKAQKAAIIDADHPFSDLKESLQELHDTDPAMVPEAVAPESITDIDNEVVSTARMITVYNILRSCRKHLIMQLCYQLIGAQSLNTQNLLYQQCNKLYI